MSRHYDPELLPEDPRFRRLRLLVTTLIATLILGVLVIAGALVIRIAQEPAADAIGAVTAEQIALPDGETVIATGASRAALTLATRDGAGAETLWLFDPRSGALIERVAIERP